MSSSRHGVYETKLTCNVQFVLSTTLSPPYEFLADTYTISASFRGRSLVCAPRGSFAWRILGASLAQTFLDSFASRFYSFEKAAFDNQLRACRHQRQPQAWDTIFQIQSFKATSPSGTAVLGPWRGSSGCPTIRRIYTNIDDGGQRRCLCAEPKHHI